MATFQVPQFVDQKAKIIGSLNMLQFGYIGGAGLVVFLLYYVFNVFVWMLISLPIVGIAVFLAFAKVNGQESHKIVQSAVSFLLGSRTYVWKRPEPKKEAVVPQKSVETKRKNMGIGDRIKSIALSVTTGKILDKKEHPHHDGEENLIVPKEGETVATFETGEKKLVKRIDY